jgi:hypothetical protein
MSITTIAHALNSNDTLVMVYTVPARDVTRFIEALANMFTYSVSVKSKRSFFAGTTFTYTITAKARQHKMLVESLV